MKDLMQEQLKLEEEMFNGGIKRFNDNRERNEKFAASETVHNRKLMKELISPMAEGIQAFKDFYQGRRGAPARALPYLRCIPNETAAYIAIKVTLDYVASDYQLPMIAMKIGERIEDQIRFTKLEGMAEKYFKKVQDSLKKNSTASYQHKHRSLVAAEKRIVANDKEGDAERWRAFPKADLGLIGFQLLEIMENTLRFEGEPVFTREVVNKGKGTAHQKAILKVSDHIAQWVHETNEALQVLSPSTAPCVVPPRDWSNPFNGGFHTEQISSKTQLVKGKRKHVKRLTQKQMPLVYEGINALQSVPWAVNTDVLDIATAVVNKDLGYAMPRFGKLIDKDNMPPCPVPACYENLKGGELKNVLTAKEWEEFLRWKAECSRLYTAETKRGSKSLATVRLIGQARRYSEFKEIFFVYTMDSRGRVYAQSSVLNPQSNDLGKAMLRSAHGESLTAEGYKQFCITGANLYGWDKVTLEEKVERTNTEDFIEMCKDIKADALTFRDWVGADEPWEFLAWALEFASYHELKEDGLEDEFKTYLPNGRDGSCSGIQHYSAMMHDEVGGAAVNLVPSDTHQDIYRAVAEKVIEKLEGILNGTYEVDYGTFKDKETEQEVEKIPTVKLKDFARAWMQIGITRGTCKKPVMTLPYGSSQITCREAIEDYLAELEEDEAKNALNQGRETNPVHPFGDESSHLSMRSALTFLTKLVWTSITEVVKAPVVAMKFIKQLSNKVVAQNSFLEWTTPTGLIVKQEIFAMSNNRVYTKLMGMSSFSFSEETDELDKYAMSGAAAPNFVHSMDASHLLLSVVAMKRAGFKFIHVIHDDFGTLANSTDKLQFILRDEMIKMYKESNMLEKYLLENEMRIGFDSELTVPPQYNLDLEVLRDSLFAFA